jgi:pimeloyl-ACP methyl ester carboxylesterase
MTIVDRFKTPTGADKYLAAYDATLELWPVPHEELDVPTSFGTTHINVAGSKDLPPLLLIHGFGFSSTQWHPNVAPLSSRFRVYMPDVIDQMGRSVPTRPLQTRQNYTAWLVEVLDSLQIERCLIAGHSYGGWLTLNLALASPQRVEQMVLLSPAASFAPMTMQFYIRGMAAGLVPVRPLIYSMLQWMSTQPVTRGEASVEQFVMGLKYFRRQPVGYPTVYTDDELRQIRIPTLLLIGEHEVIYDGKHVLQRARQLIPHIAAELVPGGGHAFTGDQADYTNHRILEFLKVSITNEVFA